MKDSGRLPTTRCGSRGNRSRYTLESPPPAEHISYEPEMVGMRYGWVEIMSAEKRWNGNRNHCRVLTRCRGCGSMQWQDLGNLKSGKSKGCQGCSQPRRIPKWLDRRLTAAKQRCENPRDKGYPEYGGRGIRFLFPSVLDAGLYLLEKYGIPDRTLELDRIDTNGDYAPGNLRFVSRTENQGNRRLTVLSEWSQMYWPYSRTVVTRKLAEGKTREDVLEDARTAVSERRKNWRLIEARLEFMTYEMPDRIIVTPYREGSSTIADTADL